MSKMTFGSLPIYKPPPGKRPERVVIIYPHQCEFLAAKPVGRGAARSFLESGIPTTTVTIPSMMARGPRMRVVAETIRKEASMKNVIPREIVQDCNLLFSWQDVAIRASEVTKAISIQDGRVCILEIHAMEKMSADSEISERHANFCRLENTELAVAPLFPVFGKVHADILKTMGIWAEAFEKITCGDVMKTIAQHYKFDLEGAIKTIERTARLVSNTQHFGLTIEVPSTEMPLPQNHPNYSFYQGNNKAPIMPNERDYCLCFRKGAGADYQTGKILASVLLPK